MRGRAARQMRRENAGSPLAGERGWAARHDGEDIQRWRRGLACGAGVAGAVPLPFAVVAVGMEGAAPGFVTQNSSSGFFSRSRNVASGKFAPCSFFCFFRSFDRFSSF